MIRKVALENVKTNLVKKAGKYSTALCIARKTVTKNIPRSVVNQEVTLMVVMNMQTDCVELKSKLKLVTTFTIPAPMHCR